MQPTYLAEQFASVAASHLPRARSFNEEVGNHIAEDEATAGRSAHSPQAAVVQADSSTEPRTIRLPRANSFVEELEQISLEDQRESVPEEFIESHHASFHRQVERSECKQLDRVLVNVYELCAFPQLNQMLSSSPFGSEPLGGALHAGVEVFGREWSYGGGRRSGSGIVCEKPRSNKQHRFRETVDMGRTALTAPEVALLIGELLEKWASEAYHWLHRNCLAFANEMCERLGVGRLPAWIDRIARGAGAVHLGVQGFAEGVQGFAEGAWNFAEGAKSVVQMIAAGPGVCVPARRMCEETMHLPQRCTDRDTVPPMLTPAVNARCRWKVLHEETFDHVPSAPLTLEVAAAAEKGTRFDKANSPVFFRERRANNLISPFQKGGA